MKTKVKILIISGACLSVILFSTLIYVAIILAGNYVIDNEKLISDVATTLLDEEGELVTKLYSENRETVSIQDVPRHVQDAFIAIEDNRFYNHHGVDPRAITRALYRDIIAGAKVEGGSTITQQLAKNVFLTNEKSWFRKTKEVLIAMNLERRYSKRELLELYLNRIYFGHGAYGIQAASKLYFNVDVSELTIDQGALLAGLAKAPNSYSPISNPERSKQRRDLVLTVMERNGFLHASESVRYKGKTVNLNVNRLSENEAYLTYIDMVLKEAEERYSLSSDEVLRGGYTIVVPMNRQLQETAYSLIKDGQYYPKQNQDAEATVSLMDVKSGGMLAVQGGRDYVRRGLNRVEVQRQPGSSFKPLAVFAPALEQGDYHPYSLLRDELVDYNGYSPRNYNHQYSGEVTMYDSITHSINAPAVWLLNEIGIETSLEMLERFDLSIPDRGLALALGGLEQGVTPLQMTKAYRVLAHQGQIIEPYFIKDIYDQNGDWIGGAEQIEKEVISPQTAWYMTRMLESVVKVGTGKNGQTSLPLAGKTGTTSFTGVDGGAKDAWFVGYTPSVVGAIWMGYDTTTSETYLQGGSSYPTALFKELINKGPHHLKRLAFEKPEGVDDLAPPVRLTQINDLSATLAMGGSGFMSVKLNWTGVPDERVHYQIYEISKGERTKLATVVGSEEYLVTRYNPFSSKEYEIVPYDSTTKRLGEPSNRTGITFEFGFH
ncbi:transglycosylase domain-containing protein [Bacillus solitudinis]|uniref:transglycosylase domain-containing protein n=1 Tax=Bacillus solitudinis TaxID=2014074 RepID=UPI001D0D3170|nr:PBP1A family penicillin-binding protein [Bacillus solitudinis]